MNIFKWISDLAERPDKKSDQLPAQNCLLTYVHPCIINNRAHIVFPRGLKVNEPVVYEKLYQYYHNKGYALKEDQRSHQYNSGYKNHRRTWAPIIVFTASLFFENSANAEIIVDIKDTKILEQYEIELSLIPNNKIRDKIQKQLGLQQAVTSNVSTSKTNPPQVKKLFHLLKSHYIKKINDPEYIIADLNKLAHYYSQYPEVIKLFESLKHKNWELSFDEHNWTTTASGNMMVVEKAIINFNTRSAAQLRLNNSCKQNPVCIASPADALLHELLHTHSMLVKTEEFLSQGGMGNVIYPYQHEYAVIDAERNLYARMTLLDAKKRPQRREHTGRLVKANCPTCIK